MSLRRKLGLRHSKDNKEAADNSSSRTESIVGDTGSSLGASSVADSSVSKRKSHRGLNMLHNLGNSQNTLSEAKVKAPDSETPEAEQLRSTSILGPLETSDIPGSPPQSHNGSQVESKTPSRKPSIASGRQQDQPKPIKPAPILVSKIGEPEPLQGHAEDAAKARLDLQASANRVNTSDRKGSTAPSESNYSTFSEATDQGAVDPLELEQETILRSSGNTAKLSLIAVTLKEAALDSPTFRASFNHLNTQIVDVLEWCDLLLQRTSKLNTAMTSMRDHANEVIEVFMPTFSHQGLLGQEYTTLACVRYSQSVKAVWTEIIMRLKTHYKHLQEQFQIIKASYKPYKVQREKFQRAQSAYDQAQADYLAMSSSDPPEDLQKAAKKATELRREYLLVAIRLTSLMSQFRIDATSSIIMALTDPMQIHRETSLQTMETAIDLHRLRQCANSMIIGKMELLAGLESACENLKRRVWESETDEAISDFQPEKASLPRDFKPKVTADSPLEQFGWVFIKRPNGNNNWCRRWAFIKNGLFGYLSLSPDLTYVVESEKVPVGDCQFISAPQLSRRFCFIVICDNVQVTVQAESLTELKGWLTVAAAVSRTHVTMTSRMHPWAPEFASPTLSEDVMTFTSLSPSQSQSHRHHSSEHLRRFVRRSANLSRMNSTSSRSDADSIETSSVKIADPANVFSDVPLSKSFTDLLNCVESTQYIDGLSTLAPSSQRMLAPPVMPTVPMPTSMTPWALVGYSFLLPTGFPNALTANFWGSVNWATYRPNEQKTVQYKPTAPEYPSYYPKELVAQDMIRRALFENMVLPGEYLVTIIRGFARLNDKQWVPARIYATNRRLLHQISIFDYSTLKTVRYSSILDVECKSTVDFDDLQVIVRNTEGDDNSDVPPYSTVVMRIFIDSGVLMQRRLQYLLDNHKSKTPDNLEKILVELTRINADYASEISRRIVPKVEEAQVLGTLWSDIDRVLKGPMTQHNLDVNQGTSETVNFGHNLSKTMKYTLYEQDFDLSPRGLFHVMFGERERAFQSNGDENSLFQKMEADHWYDRNGVLERVVHAKISGIKEIAFKMYWDSMEQEFIQRVERKDSGHLYIISERRPILRLPHGSKFSVTVRYAIVRLPGGTARLQTFADVNWRKENKTTAKTMEKVMLKLVREELKLICERIEDTIESIEGRHDDYSIISRFGKIKASEVKSLPNKESTIDVHLGRRTYFWSAVKVPLNWLINVTVVVVNELKSWLGRVASVDRVIFLGLILSLALNFVLFSSSSYNYWRAKWDVREAEAYVDSIIPATPKPGSVFTRAVYLRDIDDAILESTTFAPIPNNLCALKFEELLKNTVYDNLDELPLRPGLDMKSEQTLDQLQSLRTGLAIERNRLMTQLRLLQDEEEQLLRREFVNWLQTEVALCAKARTVIPDLNVEAFNHLKQYCLDCNNAVNISLL